MYLPLVETKVESTYKLSKCANQTNCQNENVQIYKPQINGCWNKDKKVDQTTLFEVFLSILNNSVTMHRTLGLAGHEIMALNSFLTETTISLTLENETSSTQYNSSVQQWCGAVPLPLDGASVAPYALRYSAVQCSVALTFKPKLTHKLQFRKPKE